MRQKKKWLIVTFKTTTDAMEMERYAGKEGWPGRLIPLPSEISAGCGLAWKTMPEQKEGLMKEMEEAQLRWEMMTELSLY